MVGVWEKDCANEKSTKSEMESTNVKQMGKGQAKGIEALKEC